MQNLSFWCDHVNVIFLLILFDAGFDSIWVPLPYHYRKIILSASHGIASRTPHNRWSVATKIEFEFYFIKMEAGWNGYRRIVFFFFPSIHHIHFYWLLLLVLFCISIRQLQSNSVSLGYCCLSTMKKCVSIKKLINSYWYLHLWAFFSSPDRLLSCHPKKRQVYSDDYYERTVTASNLYRKLINSNGRANECRRLLFLKSIKHRNVRSQAENFRFRFFFLFGLIADKRQRWLVIHDHDYEIIIIFFFLFILKTSLLVRLCRQRI